ncbi:hypothetical protein ACWDRR_42140, partial [Kitasatospora sp. NPDC003701]
MTTMTELPVHHPPGGPAAGGGPSRTAKARQPRRRRSSGALAGWLSVAPALLVILGFTFYPMVQSMLLSTD